MPLYQCWFCNYSSTANNKFYSHLHTHINDDTISLFTNEEIEVINHYYNKMRNSVNKYRKTDKYKKSLHKTTQ